METGFNHWVTYVGHKVGGNVTVYKMNSSNGGVDLLPARTPQFDQIIVHMLMPTTGTRFPAIPLEHQKIQSTRANPTTNTISTTSSTQHSTNEVDPETAGSLTLPSLNVTAATTLLASSNESYQQPTSCTCSNLFS